MEKIFLTPTGLEKLEAELFKLVQVERPAIITAISEARSMGDLSENAEYHSAREKQSFIEGRISDLESITARAEIIDPSKMSGDTVKFGATVQLLDLDTEDKKTYKIVGQFEADISQGLISLDSPIAIALIGNKKGDEVRFKTPAGIKEYEITSIEYK